MPGVPGRRLFAMNARTPEQTATPPQRWDSPVPALALWPFADAQAPGRGPAQHTEWPAHDSGEASRAAFGSALEITPTPGSPRLLRCRRGGESDRGGGRRHVRRPTSVIRNGRHRKSHRRGVGGASLMIAIPTSTDWVPADVYTRQSNTNSEPCTRGSKQMSREMQLAMGGCRLLSRESPVPDQRTRPGARLSGTRRGVAGCP